MSIGIQPCFYDPLLGRILCYGIMLAMLDTRFHWEYIYILIKLLKIFGLLPGAVAAYFVQRWAQRWRQARAQEGWPSVDGVVVSTKVVSEGWRNHLAEVTYSYCVGEYRSGTYLRKFSREEDAAAFARAMREQRPRVHYKEGSPDVSTLLDRDLEMLAPIMLIRSH